MLRLDLTLPTIEENLALDEALLLEAQDGGPEMLRLWEFPSPAVVLGCNGSIADDVDADACRRDGVPIGRRCSGGGTVLLGPGCLAFSLILSLERRPELRGITDSYRVLLGKVAAAIGNGAALHGSSDLAAADRKISGNAQRRLAGAVLHHGTLLAGLDIGLMSKYLREPRRRPEYRGARTHAEFAANLVGAGAAELGDAIAAAFDAANKTADRPRERVRRLVVEKYSDAEWINRR